MKSKLIAYLLWCLFPFCGLHRLYLGKSGTGILYLFTGGLFGIGQLIDLFLIPGMVENENLKWQIEHGATVNITIQGQVAQPISTKSSSRPVSGHVSSQLASGSKKDLETTILTLARKFQGKLTPLELAANSSLSLEEADKALEDIVRKGYANMTVTDTGNIVYEFPGFLQFDTSSSQELEDGYDKI